MRNRLLIFRGFAHDSQSVLAAIHGLALVGIELCTYFSFGIIFDRLVGMELRIAAFADAKRDRRSFYDPKLAFCHDRSLAHLAGTV